MECEYLSLSNVSQELSWWNYGRLLLVRLGEDVSVSSSMDLPLGRMHLVVRDELVVQASSSLMGYQYHHPRFAENTDLSISISRLCPSENFQTNSYLSAHDCLWEIRCPHLENHSQFQEILSTWMPGPSRALVVFMIILATPETIRNDVVKVF